MAVRKIRIKRPIIVEGEHAEAGAIFEVPGHVAHDLVGSGFAEFHVEDGEQPAPSTPGVQMLVPDHRDPKPVRVQGKPKAKNV